MAGPIERTVAPRRIAARDLSGLQLTPMEGFVLSQIDGRTSIADLEIVCGQTTDGVAAILDRLAGAGLIEFPAAAPAEATGRAAPGFPSRRATPPPPPSSVPPPDSPSAGSLTPEEIKRIDRWVPRSAAADFYRLLQVPRKASRDEIRRGYFHYAKQFHPDAFYGRDLGVHAPKLDRIFRQLTRAYEVLSRQKSRHAYDEYLADQQILRGQEEEEEAWAEEERISSTPPAPAQPGVAGAVSRGTPVGGAPSAAALEPEGGERPPVGPSGIGSEPPDRPAARAGTAGEEEGGAAEPVASPLSSAAGTGIEERRGPPAVPRGDSPADRWRRERMTRELSSLLVGRRRRPDRSGDSYLDSAEEAARGGEWGRVFGMLEVAAKLGVTEPRRAALEHLGRAAGKELAALCLRQARFAEATADPAAALRHAEDACRYFPDDPESWHLVARFRLRQGRDLHQARDAALKALAIEPQTSAYRLTLARIYLAAGLAKSARREAETVLQAATDDEEARAILAEARRATT